MDNKDLIETTKDIVVAMINSNLLTAHSQEQVNTIVTKSIEDIYKKLSELNSKTVNAGNTYRKFN